MLQHLNLFTTLETLTPKIVTLRIRDSTYKFWGTQSFRTQDSPKHSKLVEIDHTFLVRASTFFILENATEAFCGKATVISLYKAESQQNSAGQSVPLFKDKGRNKLYSK